MGRSTVDSVTDTWGVVHGLPWLRVAERALADAAALRNAAPTP